MRNTFNKSLQWADNRLSYLKEMSESKIKMQIVFLGNNSRKKGCRLSGSLLSEAEIQFCQGFSDSYRKKNISSKVWECGTTLTH